MLYSAELHGLEECREKMLAEDGMLNDADEQRQRLTDRFQGSVPPWVERRPGEH